MAICIRCNKVLRKKQKIYCSNLCQITYQYESFVQQWKRECESGKNTVVTKNISKHLKRYLIESNGEQCSSCGWRKRNEITGKVPLEVDHIDGNAENNVLKNLRLLCPNCHSLTPHFRNLNKGHGRSWRIKK
jgi:5-methylcytosine-specific restriction endonuclease McrA